MGAKNWKFVGQYQESDVKEIQNRFALPKPIALFLAARGLKADQIKDFLNPSLENLSDPYRFPGIQNAAKRLWEAIVNQEPILIHGDYDTDGITASALLALTLRANGAIVHTPCLPLYLLSTPCPWDREKQHSGPFEPRLHEKL